MDKMCGIQTIATKINRKVITCRLITLYELVYIGDKASNKLSSYLEKPSSMSEVVPHINEHSMIWYL